jgi:hypothetical protein
LPAHEKGHLTVSAKE